MTDYRHDLLFGIVVHAAAEPAQHVVELAELADQSGLDLFGVPDHPYQPELFDSLALLSFVASRTERVRILPDLANLPLRPPAMLARTAATLDILSNGRFEMGLAAGALWDGIATQGGPRRGPGAAIEALEEAIQILRALWTPGPEVSFSGAHYTLEGAKPGPFPVHGISIWNGAYRPRMLRTTGRVADGWVPSSPYLPPERLPQANRTIDEAATEAGRSPKAVRRLYNIAGEFTQNGTEFLRGPAAMWVEQLTELTLDQGMSGYILYLPDSADTIRKFAAEVVPGVREMVTAERAHRK